MVVGRMHGSRLSLLLTAQIDRGETVKRRSLMLNKSEILKLVEFCVLMQTKDGIISKAPSYISEKWLLRRENGLVLSSKNKSIFDQWRRIWLKEALNEVDIQPVGVSSAPDMD